MYDHVGLKVRDLAKSVRFYGAALAAIGYKQLSLDDSGASYGADSGATLYLSRTQSEPSTGVHIALRARDHAAIQAFHARGLAAGGRDNGEPGFRKDYSSTYYAAFLLDPDGNNIEAVNT